MRRIRLPLAGCFALLAFAISFPASAQEVLETQQADFRVVTVVDGLENPWSMAFLPNGDLLVTERPGRVRIVRNGTLDPEPIPGVPEVRARGQGGLMDIALHPEFESNQFLYLTFSKSNADDSEGTTVLARARFDGQALTDFEEIFEADAWSTTNGHYGSRLAFDEDGYLFMTVGDRQAPSRGDLEAHPAQDLSNHQGTILRLNDDGSPADGNPFADQAGAHPEIWSYGHRSPQGFAIHPQTGDLWETEHGPQGGDELNLIRGGTNFGWPVIGYGVNYGPGEPIHATQQREGMEQPVHFWVPSIATSGLMIYDGDAFPAWQGDFFAGGLAGQVVVRVELEGEEVVGEETILQGHRVRHIIQGPDDYIYVATENRGGGTSPILRLEPAMEE